MAAPWFPAGLVYAAAAIAFATFFCLVSFEGLSRLLVDPRACDPRGHGRAGRAAPQLPSAEPASARRSARAG